MRQVPNYLIIGNGRLARHFQHYFGLLKLSFTTWHREEPHAHLTQKIAQSSHILILINDDAIESFIDQHLQQTQAILIHCSGSLVSQKAYGAHPLMSFTKQLYTLELYQQIPFVIDENAPLFSNLFPGLNNFHARLSTQLKAKYHALCVLSGNFSCLLWQKIFDEFEKKLQLPKSIAEFYLTQQTNNLLQDYQGALTGPLVRNDKNTMQRNLAALNQDPFQKIYQGFIDCYEKINEEKMA